MFGLCAKEPGCACALFWAGIWLGLLCAFGPNAWGGPVAFQWAGLQALQRIFFLCRGIKKQPAAKRWQGAPCFRRKPRFAFRFALPLPSLGFLQKNKNRPPAQKPEVFDFTMADRLLGKRQWANLASSKGKFTFLPYKICVLSKCKNRLNARGSLYFRAAKKTLGLISQTLKVPFYACIFFRWPETLPLKRLSYFPSHKRGIRSVSGGWRLALRPGAQWARGTASRKHTSSRCYDRIRCSWDRRPVRRKCRA